MRVTLSTIWLTVRSLGDTFKKVFCAAEQDRRDSLGFYCAVAPQLQRDGMLKLLSELRIQLATNSSKPL